MSALVAAGRRRRPRPWTRCGPRAQPPYPGRCPDQGGPGTHGQASTRGSPVSTPTHDNAQRPTGVVRVALLGCGTVGSQVVRLLHEHADDLAARAGARLELVGIAVRDAAAER